VERKIYRALQKNRGGFKVKELVIISGKGGTGKTSITGAFASIAKKVVLCDADVDASDLHLILSPRIIERMDFFSGHEAEINREKCTKCGLCIELCRWNAIREDFSIDPIDCEGCGVCYHFCPEGAIEFREKKTGEYFISETRFGPMVHARLGPGEENSGKLVATVRQKAKEIAEKGGFELILTDGPPGIGCPVISSIGGVSACLIIAEPTVSGIHDMERVIDLARHFNVPAMICINKADLNPEETERIESFAKERNIPVLGKIPFDPIFTSAMIQQKTVIEFDRESSVSKKIMEVWEKAQAFLDLG